VDWSAATPGVGLRARSWEDGPVRHLARRLLSPASKTARYVYLRVSDHWRFDLAQRTAGDYLLDVVSEIPCRLGVQYDGRDPNAPLDGAYTAARRVLPKTDAPATRHRFRFAAPRFSNRQNGGADFRLVLRGEEVRLRSVTLTPIR